MKLGIKKVIEVTKKDILKGKPESRSCPVSLALKREFHLDKDEYIFVDGVEILLNDQFYFKTSKEVNKFIGSFDDCFDSDNKLVDKKKRDLLKPFKFTLEF